MNNLHVTLSSKTTIKIRRYLYLYLQIYFGTYMGTILNIKTKYRIISFASFASRHLSDISTYCIIYSSGMTGKSIKQILDWQVKGLEFEPKARTSDFSKLGMCVLIINYHALKR